MPKVLEYNATLVERIDLTPSLALFRVLPDDMPPPEKRWFEGGQYVTLGLNGELDGEPTSVQRAYSIASEPEERRWLEFYIRLVGKPESRLPLTHMLWKMKEKDRIYIGKKIVGHFTLGKTIGDDDSRLKIFVAAGTGLAPFVSIIKSFLAQEKYDVVQKDFVVLHGASYAHDLGYKEDLELVFEDVKKRYLPTVSRPGENAEWSGDVGRVETFFDDEKLDALEARIGLGPGKLTSDRAVVYICGLRGTIAETVTRLVRRGFVPDDRKLRRLLDIPKDTPASLFFEQYDTTPIIDPTEEKLVERLKRDFASS
jgi:ferredoxin--NADP+ reductase